MMANVISNGSLNLERVTQAELEKVRQLHDEHSKDIDHENKTIDKEDTELNYHRQIMDLDKLLEDTYGKEIQAKNDKLTADFNAGKVSLARYNERKLTVNKYLNHSGKSPKRAFTLGVVYIGDEAQTKAKLDALDFSYEVKQIKGEDGLMHNHFHLTDPEQRKQWKQLWVDAFNLYVNQINKQNSGIKIFDLTIHMDEASPHAHLKILNVGHSEQGKLSYNITQSLSDFNASVGCDRKYNKVTEKSPRKRLSGKLTLKDTRQILDSFAVKSFNWSAKHNGLDIKGKFQHKGEKAKLTNGMTASEYKQYQASYQELTDAYEAVTGSKAVSKDNQALSPLDMVNGLKRASKQAEEDKKKADQQKQELEDQQNKLDNQRELDQFNSFVRQKFIERLNQRRLVKFRQREKALNDRENEQKENLLNTLVTVDPEHTVKPELLKKNEVPQKLRTQVGRSQHKRQTLQYLAKATSIAVAKVREKASEAEQKVKNVADNFIKIMYGTPENYEMAKAKNVGSQKIVGSIQESQHPFSAKREKELLNDPSIKIKQALLFATNQQLKQGQHYLQSGQEKTWKPDDKLPGE